MNLKAFFIFLIVISFISTVSAWTFNGTIRDVNGNFLNNTFVNITIWQMGAEGPSINGSISTYSNLSGWFNLTVSENSNWMYKPVIKFTNLTTNSTDYIGQSLPEFPYREIVNTSDIKFYLRPAGTINITAINSSGDRITFRYQVKDTKLGYPIASGFATAVDEAIIQVPRDRNYSIMVYPNQAIPVSFNWNNFSSNAHYIAGLSTYNLTTHTIQKQFNCTDNLIRITGYIKNSTKDDFQNWSEFTVVPFLLESGNMVFLGDNAGMPYNMSAWNGQGDEYNLSTGFYNITLPGPAESATYLLFATARNGTRYYGGYRNISLSYSDTPNQLNFTMYPLMSTNWGSANNNITLHDAVTWAPLNISSAKQRFNLVNSSNQTIENMNAHLEIKLDYSSYGATEFTFMTDLSSVNASFYLPLLNTSVKEINIYSQTYAPKMVGTKTVAQINSNPNITMLAFNPGDIDGTDLSSSVYVSFYTSNSTCDVPSPPTACSLISAANMDNFNPLAAIIGGGALSFRMGLTSSKIEVHYVNVDMLASGPPDALFDDSATTKTSGSFEAALRFGSNGPKIYDYVLISIPYTKGSNSTTGLNDTANVSMSIPILYDENWVIIWNSTANGTSGSALAGNYSHYNASSQWQALMVPSNCTRNSSELSSTVPCYIDTASNRTWIRLPHFSGTKPSITGAVITADAAVADDNDDGTGGSGGSIVSKWVKEIKLNGSELNLGQTLKILKKNYRLTFNISGMGHYVGITNITNTTVTIEVASTPQTATLLVGDEKKFDVTEDGVYDLSVKLNSINSTGLTAELTVRSIQEKATEENAGATAGTEEVVSDEEKGVLHLTWFWILAAIVIILIAGSIWYFINNKN